MNRVQMRPIVDQTYYCGPSVTGIAIAIAVLCAGMCVAFADAALAQTAKKKKTPTAKATQVKIDENAKDKVKDWLKDNCNDPSRLQFVAFGKPFNFHLWRVYVGEGDGDRDIGAFWPPFGDGGTAIYAKYRSANALGALVLEEKVFFLNDQGRVFRHEDIRNVRQPSADDGGDPAMKAFLQGFE